MGRKSKINKNQETSSLAYNGKISISLKKGKKTLSKQTFKNNGSKFLFLFLCKCLAGRYGEAESFRPRYIVLYNVGDYESTVPSNIWSKLINSNKTSTNNGVLYKETPTADYTDVSESYVSSAQVKFSFLIPFTQIDSSKDTNALALYSNNQELNSPLAYFVIKDVNGNLGRLFDPTIIDPHNNDYNIFIEWTMEIDNKITE